MPSIGSGISVLQHGYDDNRCRCCPYGYHIDVDFVPFTKKMLSRESEGERLQALRDKWRSERQSMDMLLGVVKAKLAMRSLNQDQDETESYQPANNSTWISQVRSVKEIEFVHRSASRHRDTSFGSTSHVDILGNGLSEAVTDFEEALSRTRPEARTLSYSIPDSQKFHTFPRIKPASKDYQHDTTTIGLMSSSNCFSNKGSTTSTSASTVIMKEATAPQKDTKAESNCSLVTNNADSIYNHSFQLNGLNRDAQSDKRFEYLEEQVKIIPELEVKLTLLKEEKRQLMKLLDNEKQKCAKLEEQVTSSREEQKMPILSPIAPPRRKTRDAGVGKVVLTRDVGISHTMPRTRSVGVGGSIDLLGHVLERSTSRPDSCSPTGSIPGTIRRRIRSFDVGVQVKEHDFKDGNELNILQIVEKVDCGVQAGTGDELDRSLTKPRILTKNSGVLAKPRTGDIGCTIKPTCKDIGVATTTDRLRETKTTRTVGVSAQLIEASLSPIEKPAIKKLSKTLGVNTEQPKLKTIGVNTIAEIPGRSDSVTKESPSRSDYVRRESPTRAEYVRKESPTRSEYVRRESPTRSEYVRKESPTRSEYVRRESPARSEFMNRESPTRSEYVRKESPVRSEYMAKVTVPTPSPTRHTPDSAAERDPTPEPIEDKPEPPPPPQSPPPSQPPSTPDSKIISRIPRLATPVSPTSPRLSVKRMESPVDDRGDTSEESQINASSIPSPSGMHTISGLRKPVFQRSDTFTKEIHFPISRFPPCQLEPLEEEDKERPSTSGSFASLQEPREKAVPSKEMQGALKVLNDALLRGRTTQQVTSAISIILHEWFRVAGTKTANPLDVEDYLDFFESYSPQLLRYIVNMPDGNGNTAMHYAVSHGNFDVVSILLDSKVCDPNKANKAGYTSVMLVSLAKILTETHRQVVRRLFSLGDVNIKAAQHGQTALMLGASHGRLDTVKLLIEAGADVNIQDEDGSTSLMCAAEHGHGDIVKYLLAQADCDPNVTDNDGSTALSVAMEAGHKDIGVMLYAHMHFLKGPPTPTSSASLFAKRSRSTTPSSRNSESPASSSHTSPLVSKKHHMSLNQ